MATGPRAAVEAPRNRAPRTGLIPAAAVRTDVDPRWENGFSFAPEPCGDGQALEIVCGPTAQKEFAENPDTVDVDPALLVAGHRCTTLDVGAAGPERTNRHLTNVESFLLERLFWTGVVDPATTPDPTPFPDRPHLADGNATVLAGGTAVHPIHAVALLDQALTACLHGAAGMIHVTPYLLVWLAHDDLVERVGNVWLTPNGHTVVAGSGYTGGGPRPEPGGALPAPPDLLANPPADQWAYGTGAVEVLLGDRVPLDDVDRTVNDREIFAERAAAAFWGGCCQFAVQVDIPLELITA